MTVADEIKQLKQRVSELERELGELRTKVQSANLLTKPAWQDIANRWPNDEVGQRAYREVQEIMKRDREADKKRESYVHEQDRDARPAPGKRKAVNGRGKTRKAS